MFEYKDRDTLEWDEYITSVSDYFSRGSNSPVCVIGWDYIIPGVYMLGLEAVIEYLENTSNVCAQDILPILADVLGSAKLSKED